MGLKMWNQMAGALPPLAPSGYVCEVNDDCNACGACAEDVCSFQAISMDGDAERAVISFEKCMGCGVCVDACPVDALHLRRDPSKGDPLDLDELLGRGSTA